MLRELLNPRKKCHVAPLPLSLTMPFSSVPKVAVVETFGRMYINALWTMLSILKLNNHSLKSRLVGDGFYFCKILSLTLFLSTWRIFVDIFLEFILVCFLYLNIDFDILWKTSLQNEIVQVERNCSCREWHVFLQLENVFGLGGITMYITKIWILR